MGRPTDEPDWATDANYAAGSDPWSGTSTKSAPSAGKIQKGYIPDDDDFAEEDNWILNNHGKWLKYLESVTGGHFGDGSDGDAVFDGVNTFSFAVLAGGMYTLGRDVYLNNATVAAYHINTGGHRVYVKGTLTFSGSNPIIENNGTDATNGSHTVGAPAGTIGGGTDSGDGGIAGGAGPTTGTNVTLSIGGAGGAGGDGDNGGGPHTGAGAAGGTKTAPLASLGSFRHPSTLHQGHIFGISGGVSVGTVLAGGAGGGGGYADDTGATDGGGGGSGGGVMVLSAFKIVLTSNATVSCKGGAGANRTNHAGGGGGGGGGGLFLTYASLTLNGHTFTRSVAGGAGGTATIGTTSAGTAGSAGTLIEHDLGA